MWELEFYSHNGRCPMQEYLDDLRKTNRKEHDRLFNKIGLLENLGNQIFLTKGGKISKKLEDDLYELKSDHNRVIYFFFLDNKIVLLHAFRKDKQKTPISQIEKALRERKTYINNIKNKTV